MLELIKKLFMPRGNSFTAGELAKKFGLTLRGNADTVINGIAPIADARPGELAFYSTEKNAEAFRILPIETLKNTRASVILLQPENAAKAPKGATLLITDSPRGEIAKILGMVYAPRPRHGVSIDAIVERGVCFRKKRTVYIGQFATVERGAFIDTGVQISPNVFIGRNVILGENTVVHAGAHIENATIGANCVIYSGAVIGKDGFGFTRQRGKNVFIPHTGRVILGDRVSVGANSCLDRGLMGDTKIGEGTKIDNLCHVAHGVIIGRECFLAAGTGIAGGVVAGDRVMFGGHAGIANKVKIGDDAEIGPNSGVFRDVGAGEKILGYPATTAIECFRMMAWTKSQMRKKDKK